MFLWSDLRCIEMVGFGKRVLEKEDGLVVSRAMDMPIVKEGKGWNIRRFHMHPVITKVCTFPICEDEVCPLVGLQRPLFYCELDSVRYTEMKRRVKLSKVERGVVVSKRDDTAPKRPERRLSVEFKS